MTEQKKPYGYLWYTRHMEYRFTHGIPREEDHVGEILPVYIDAAPSTTQDPYAALKVAREALEWVIPLVRFRDTAALEEALRQIDEVSKS